MSGNTTYFQITTLTTYSINLQSEGTDSKLDKKTSPDHLFYTRN